LNDQPTRYNLGRFKGGFHSQLPDAEDTQLNTTHLYLATKTASALSPIIHCHWFVPVSLARLLPMLQLTYTTLHATETAVM